MPVKGTETSPTGHDGNNGLPSPISSNNCEDDFQPKEIAAVTDAKTISCSENFKLYADDDDDDRRGEFVSDIKIKVDSPQRHAETFETYVSYQITVTSTRPEYPESEYVVRRRYNDFLWLKNKLVENYPTRLIPPLPSKHSFLGHLDRYAKEFIILRMVMLRRFVKRIAQHPILSYSEHFKIFLTATISELLSAQKNRGPGLLFKVSDSLYNITMTYTVKEKCQEFEDFKRYLIGLQEKLESFEKILYRLHKERKEYTKFLNQLSIDFEKWAHSEIVLSPLLFSVGNAFSNVASIHDSLLGSPLECVTLQPIREYILYAESVREALIRRDNVHIQYELSVDEIHRRKSDSSNNPSWEKWASTPDSDSIPDSTCDGHTDLLHNAEVHQDKLYVANEDIRSDLERWSIEKKSDMKRILLTLSDYYIQYYEKSLAAWENSLRKVNMPLNKE